MLRSLAFAAVAGGALSLPTLKMEDCQIEYQGGKLVSSCDLQIPGAGDINTSVGDLNQEMANMRTFATAQGAENEALKALISALTTRLATLEGTHASDHAALNNEIDVLESAYKKADANLQQAVTTIILTPGAKGDQGDQGIQGAKGEKGADGHQGVDGKDGQHGACPPGSGQTAAACAPCQQGTTFSADFDSRSCQRVRVCTNGDHIGVGDQLEFETTTPTASRNRDCATVNVCTNGEYEKVAPTTTSDRTCATHSAICNAHEYEIRPATAFQDRECKQKVCVCDHGTPTRGSACSKHGGIECTACDGGWTGVRCDTQFAPKTVSFQCTGKVAMYTVPGGASKITFSLKGASGGGSNAENRRFPGGNGGLTSGTMTVKEGDSITLEVGCGGMRSTDTKRAYPAGGLGAMRSGYIMGNGGGRSSIKNNGVEIATAGGGGGAGGTGWGSGQSTSGGCGGGSSGGVGGASRGASYGGGGGGMQSGPGNPGNNHGGQYTHYNFDAYGGRHRSAVAAAHYLGGSTITNAAGGGGDGWYGGGGGGVHGGGGGGSGYCRPGLPSCSMTQCGGAKGYANQDGLGGTIELHLS
jgi:hypothetical protein